MLSNTVCIKISHIHRFCVFCTELEDVTHFDTAADSDNRLSTNRADSAFEDLCNINIFYVSEVTFDVKTCAVVIFFVSTANKVVYTLEGCVKYNLNTLRKTDRTDKAFNDTAFESDKAGMDLFLEVVAKLCFVNFKVASDEYDNVFVSHILLVNNSLAESFVIYREEARNLLDSFSTGCVNLCKRSDLALFVVHNAVCSFHISLIAAFRADSKSIFADLCEKHKFVRDLTAHHTGVGFNSDNVFRACASKDSFISLEAEIVILLKISLRCVEGVCVLHCKFTNTDKTAAATGLITEFCLDLVDHKGEIRIGFCSITSKVNSSFLMCHTENHVIAASILEASHFAADACISAGFFPNSCGHNNGHKNFLTVNSVHFLTDNIFYLSCNALCRHKERKATVAEVFHISAAHHESVACNGTIFRSFLKTFSEQFANLHFIYLLYFKK